MARHPTEMSLFLVLDVSDPLDVRPPVVEVNVGSNMAYNTKPGVAILVTVDAGNPGESCRALAGLIRGEDKYAWVRHWPHIDTFLRQWDPDAPAWPPAFPSYRSIGGKADE